MTIELRKETTQRLTASLKRYLDEFLDEDIGDLKAALFLDFVLKEFGPVIYNQAILDAQAHLQERVGELDGACYEPEFQYWDDSKK